jgi:cytochrome c5
MKKMLLITASVALMGAVATAHAEGAGEKTYKMACFACHGTGAAGSPKFGDKAAWKDRIAKGMDTLHKHALQGFQGNTGVMPPKGGRTDLSDADVMAAVDYMVSNAK